MRYEHLLGSIGRPYFHAQAEERESSLVGIVGTPFSRHLQNGTQNQRKRPADYSTKQSSPPQEGTKAPNCSCILLLTIQHPRTPHIMPSKCAADPDGIPPTFLKALGSMTKAELLSTFNESFSKGVLLGVRKEATIFPLKKPGKPPVSISSYRPVRLASCDVKTIERMVHSHLYNLGETKRWLCSEQAGFRKRRSC